MVNESENTYIRKMAKKMYIVNSMGGCCSKCGETRLYLLSFHHLDPKIKEFTITSQDIRLSNFKREADKCIVICHNCHRELHHNLIVDVDTKPRRMKSEMLVYKNTQECCKCGYDKCNSALEFHHRDSNEKEITLSSPYNYLKSYLPDEVKIELDKCDVLCSNCHQEVHFNIERFESLFDKISSKSLNLKEVQPKLDHSEIFRLFTEDKMRVIELARKFSASKGTICDILKKYGVTTKMSDTKINKDVVLDLANKGYNGTEIAKMIGKSQGGVSRILNPKIK